MSRPAPGSTQPHPQWIKGRLQGLEWLERKTDQSSLSSGGINNEMRYGSTLSYAAMHKDNL